MKISHNIFAFVLSLFIASAIHAQQNEPKFEIKFLTTSSEGEFIS